MAGNRKKATIQFIYYFATLSFCATLYLSLKPYEIFTGHENIVVFFFILLVFGPIIRFLNPFAMLKKISGQKKK